MNASRARNVDHRRRRRQLGRVVFPGAVDRDRLFLRGTGDVDVARTVDRGRKAHSINIRSFDISRARNLDGDVIGTSEVRLDITGTVESDRLDARDSELVTHIPQPQTGAGRRVEHENPIHDVRRESCERVRASRDRQGRSRTDGDDHIAACLESDRFDIRNLPAIRCHRSRLGDNTAR